MHKIEPAYAIMKTTPIKKAFTLWKHGIADNYERFLIGIFILKIVFLVVNPSYFPDELVESNFFISLAIYVALPLLALYTVICIGYAAFLYLIEFLDYCVEQIRTSGKLLLYNRFVWFLAVASFLNFLVSMIVKSSAPMPVYILFHGGATIISGIIVWKVPRVSTVSATPRRSHGITILFYIVMMILGMKALQYMASTDSSGVKESRITRGRITVDSSPNLKKLVTGYKSEEDERNKRLEDLMKKLIINKSNG